MALIKLIEIDEFSKLGIWEIKEQSDDLKWALQWGQEDIKQYGHINDEHKKMQWLCSRVLLRKMLHTNEFIDLRRDENGKPFLNNLPQKISISHSGERVAIMISNRNCGVDIQLMDRKMEKIAAKFISEDEKTMQQDELSSIQIYVYWCAKEAMYKLYGRKKLDFRQHLILQPFPESISGKVRGRIEKDDFIRELKIYYEKMDNYMLAYVLDKEKKESITQ